MMSAQIMEMATAYADGLRRAASWVAHTTAAIESLNSRLTRAAEPVQHWVQPHAMLSECIRRIPETVAEVCEPCCRQIRIYGQGRIEPPDTQEQLRLLTAAFLLTLMGAPPDPEARGMPRLEHVAFFRRRRDLMVEILQGRYPHMKHRLRHQRWGERPDDMDMLVEMHAVLGGDFADRMRARLDGLDAPIACQQLAGWLSEQYVYTVLRNAHLDEARREKRLQELTDLEADVEEDLAGHDEASRVLETVDVRRHRAAYLQESDRPELDEKILQAVADGMSLAELARHLALSPTTVRSRWQRFARHMRAKLME